jgi:uncharacterized protein
MLYRRLGNTQLSVSVLGFGAMRLPIEGAHGNVADSYDPHSPIDEKEATRMIEYAVANGVNYFDSAYMYHGGKSEVVLGKALKPYRDRVLIATKLPAVLVQGPDDFEKFLGEQLQRLATDYVDVYLLHGLHREVWSRLKEMEILSFLDRIHSEGRARFVGFSFHDDLAVFKEIVDSYDWKLCQIQYNYYDEDAQAGKVGLNYAAAKDMGIVIMEPVRGGMLAEPLPPEVEALWDSADVKRSPAEWALRWVWNHAEVSTALSGMSTMDQVIANVRVAEEGKANSLTPTELALVEKVRKTYRTMFKVGCTGCGYCMPCKAGVAIPTMFSSYNDSFVFPHKAGMVAALYNMFLKPEQRASACIECGECEEKCPQHLPIREELKNVHERLSRE